MVKRGDIVYLQKSAYLNEENHIQGGFRPMLVVSNDVGNTYGDICLLVPLTRNQARADFPTHAVVNNVSVALCEQIFTINQNWIDRKVGEVSAHEMKKVDKCLLVSLGVMV